MVWGYDRIQSAYNTIMASTTKPQYVLTFNGRQVTQRYTFAVNMNACPCCLDLAAGNGLHHAQAQVGSLLPPHLCRVRPYVHAVTHCMHLMHTASLLCFVSRLFVRMLHVTCTESLHHALCQPDSLRLSLC